MGGLIIRSALPRL